MQPEAGCVWRIFFVLREMLQIYSIECIKKFSHFSTVHWLSGQKPAIIQGLQTPHQYTSRVHCTLMGSPNPKLSREHHCHKQLNRSKNRVITYDIGKNHQDPKKDLMNREILIDCHKNIYDDCIYYFNYLLRVLSRTNKALIVFSWCK